MSLSDPGILLDQMFEAARRARSYVEGMSKDAFLADTRTQEAVVLNLLVIGETATKLSRDHESFLAGHPDLPWRSMRGMRNRIAHGYFELDMNVVWETVLTALPDLVYRLPSIRDAGRNMSGAPDLPESGDV